MKLCESWLREWVDPTVTREKLAAILTLGGFEVEEVAPVKNQGKEDYVFDISITPNRGDCLSLRGMAREISALTKTPLKEMAIPPVKAAGKGVLSVMVTAEAGCPRYVGREIRQVKADITTPAWLKERLENSGIHSISPIVDITNYVMLELGQPMHAFDLDTIKQGINVRLSKKGEKIALLDGSTKELNNETIVIADQEKPLAIAGVMGGLDSSVTLLTTNIFLESAFFSPPAIAKQRQYYGLNSDSSYRFERGVDPTMQTQVLERATQLILEICGGAAGPLVEVSSQKYLPPIHPIILKQEMITKLLGITLPAKTIEEHFTALNFSYQHEHNQWQVQVPAYRFDLSLPEDLIEEIARLYGYDNIPTHPIKSVLQNATMNSRDWSTLRQAFSDRGYHEVVSYSFIDKKLQALLDVNPATEELVNPISAEMAVMRTNLWPGLVSAWLYNNSRQQSRARLFEIGACFNQQHKKLVEETKIGGLVTGSANPEQWGIATRKVDFYDVKGMLEDSLSIPLIFKPESHSILHPGQSAAIYSNDKKIGIMGAFHPMVLEELQLAGPIFVFELDLNSLEDLITHNVKEISKFPEIRRDIAILVNQAIPAQAIQDTIKVTAGDWLKDSFIFDVYQGKGVAPGLKSIALALVLQHPTRTLIDEEVAALMERVINTLKDQLGAVLRS